MRTLDLLRNHPWNVQALIEHNEAESFYTVKCEAIEGFGIAKTTQHADRIEAYKHAHMVVFGDLRGCQLLLLSEIIG